MGNSRTPANDPAPTYLPPPWALRMQAEADRAELRILGTHPDVTARDALTA